MNEELDPNLDDPELIQTMFECSEDIARGDGCTQCNAVWSDHQLIHDDACLYVVVGDMLAARSAIEESWGAA